MNFFKWNKKEVGGNNIETKETQEKSAFRKKAEKITLITTTATALLLTTVKADAKTYNKDKVNNNSVITKVNVVDYNNSFWKANNLVKNNTAALNNAGFLSNDEIEALKKISEINRKEVLTGILPDTYIYSIDTLEWGIKNLEDLDFLINSWKEMPRTTFKELTWLDKFNWLEDEESWKKLIKALYDTSNLEKRYRIGKEKRKPTQEELQERITFLKTVEKKWLRKIPVWKKQMAKLDKERGLELWTTFNYFNKYTTELFNKKIQSQVYDSQEWARLIKKDVYSIWYFIVQKQKIQDSLTPLIATQMSELILLTSGEKLTAENNFISNKEKSSLNASKIEIWSKKWTVLDDKTLKQEWFVEPVFEWIFSKTIDIKIDEYQKDTRIRNRITKEQRNNYAKKMLMASEDYRKDAENHHKDAENYRKKATLNLENFNYLVELWDEAMEIWTEVLNQSYQFTGISSSSERKKMQRDIKEKINRLNEIKTEIDLLIKKNHSDSDLVTSGNKAIASIDKTLKNKALQKVL